MPTTYYDQFFIIDPFAPPPAGTLLTKQFYQIVDANDDNYLQGTGADSIDGVDIRRVYNGDTITVNMNGSVITITGVTFYLADGREVFTPSDGTLLDNATFISSTWVSQNTGMFVSQLGPPCFAAGTLIETARGAVPIEHLAEGDMVRTADHGLQPVRWIGRSATDGRGDHAPVVFAPGSIGNERTLRVSPQHRILVRGWQAELYYGCAEVLVPAKHLVDGRRVIRERMDEVLYLHLLFDRHEIVFSEGAPSESFFPGDQILLQDRAVRAELLALFPELADWRNSAFARTARPTLKRREAGLLRAA